MKGDSLFRWKSAPVDEKRAAYIAENQDVSDLTARILSSRQIEDVASFLTPRLNTNLPDPRTLKDMEKAASRMKEAVLNHEIVGIMGDYDVDGATSTSVVKLFLESLGQKVLTFIPSREEGYGPNSKEMDHFKQEGVSLILTVDCGTTSFEPIDKAKQLGMDILVLDHHESDLKLPNADAVVNPKRIDEPADHPCRQMAAVGVCFLFIIEVNRQLREVGFYTSRPEPSLQQYLDLVALGTVCDVMKLRGVNRLFVKKGLKQMEKSAHLGLRSLLQSLQLQPPYQSYHLGFKIGPLLNAGGRVGVSETAMKLLSSENETDSEILIQRLTEYNNERKRLESIAMEECLPQIEHSLKEHPKFLFLAEENWHQGIIGIVAGHLKENYLCPVFVLSIEGNEVKGSSRSVSGIDIGTLVMQALDHGYLTRGGGHPMAAGFSLTKDKIKDFENFLSDAFCDLKTSDSVKELVYEGVLTPKGANLSFAKELERLEPFGEGNPEPLFVMRNVSVCYPTPLNGGHVRCFLNGQTGGSIKAMAFHCEGTVLFENLLMPNGQDHLWDVIGTLKINRWRGTETTQFIIKDIKLASSSDI